MRRCERRERCWGSRSGGSGLAAVATMATAGHNDRRAKATSQPRHRDCFNHSHIKHTSALHFVFVPTRSNLFIRLGGAWWMEVISNDWLQDEMSGSGLRGNGEPLRIRILIEQLSLCVMYRRWWWSVCVCALMFRIIHVSAYLNKSALKRDKKNKKKTTRVHSQMNWNHSNFICHRRRPSLQSFGAPSSDCR